MSRHQAYALQNTTFMVVFLYWNKIKMSALEQTPKLLEDKRK